MADVPAPAPAPERSDSSGSNSSASRPHHRKPSAGAASGERHHGSARHSSSSHSASRKAPRSQSQATTTAPKTPSAGRAEHKHPPEPPPREDGNRDDAGGREREREREVRVPRARRRVAIRPDDPRFWTFPLQPEVKNGTVEVFSHSESASSSGVPSTRSSTSQMSLPRRTEEAAEAHGRLVQRLQEHALAIDAIFREDARVSPSYCADAATQTPSLRSSSRNSQASSPVPIVTITASSASPSRSRSRVAAVTSASALATVATGTARSHRRTRSDTQNEQQSSSAAGAASCVASPGGSPSSTDPVTGATRLRRMSNSGHSCYASTASSSWESMVPPLSLTPAGGHAGRYAAGANGQPLRSPLLSPGIPRNPSNSPLLSSLDDIEDEINKITQRALEIKRVLDLRRERAPAPDPLEMMFGRPVAPKSPRGAEDLFRGEQDAAVAHDGWAHRDFGAASLEQRSVIRPNAKSSSRSKRKERSSSSGHKHSTRSSSRSKSKSSKGTGRSAVDLQSPPAGALLPPEVSQLLSPPIPEASEASMPSERLNE
eukprot:m51a1_g11770 hypothetical protein (545) ;mRNA; r:243159-245199